MARAIVNNRRNRSKPYSLNSNLFEGFEYSVQTNQNNMALQYAKLIIDDLVARIETLENDKVEPEVSETEESTPVKRTTRVRKAEDTTE